jgi:hypothetical protein
MDPASSAVAARKLVVNVIRSIFFGLMDSPSVGHRFQRTCWVFTEGDTDTAKILAAQM